ncbi:MAG: GDYXXLXY domain-containing protein [Limisphaerales bacterium]
MKLKLLILVLALQTAWLLATVATQEYALNHGTVILLDTRRVDPRDMLRGDFLILNYKISDVPTNLFSPPVKKDSPFGANIFVAVAPGTNGFHEVTRASTNKFTPATGEVMLHGKQAYAWWAAAGSIHVDYGIEKYFVAEGTGNPTGKLTVQAVVPASGRATIQQVFLDGKPYAGAMKDSAARR